MWMMPRILHEGCCSPVTAIANRQPGRTWKKLQITTLYSSPEAQHSTSTVITTTFTVMTGTPNHNADPATNNADSHAYHLTPDALRMNPSILDDCENDPPLQASTTTPTKASTMTTTVAITAATTPSDHPQQWRRLHQWTMDTARVEPGTLDQGDWQVRVQ